MKIKNMAYWKAKNKISPLKLDLKNVVVVDSEYAKKQKKEEEEKRKKEQEKKKKEQEKINKQIEGTYVKNEEDIKETKKRFNSKRK